MQLHVPRLIDDQASMLELTQAPVESISMCACMMV